MYEMAGLGCRKLPTPFQLPLQNHLAPTCSSDVIAPRNRSSAVRCMSALPALFDCGSLLAPGDVVDDVILGMSARCGDSQDAPDDVIEIELRNGQLLPVRTDNESTSDRNRMWIRCMRPARDRCEQNIQLALDRPTNGVGGLSVRLSTSRDVMAGDELLVWYGEALSLQLGVPIITPANILADNQSMQYVCRACGKHFRFPNALKSHVMRRCCNATPAGGNLSRQSPPEVHVTIGAVACAPITQQWPIQQLPTNDCRLPTRWPAQPETGLFDGLFNVNGLMLTGSSNAGATGSQYWRPVDVACLPTSGWPAWSTWMALTNNFRLSQQSGAAIISKLSSPTFCKRESEPEADVLNAKLFPVVNRSPVRSSASSMSPSSSLDDRDVIGLVPGSRVSSFDFRKFPAGDHVTVESRTPDTTGVEVRAGNGGRASDGERAKKDSGAAAAPGRRGSGVDGASPRPAMHRCVHCGKLYSRRYGLTIHLRTHTGLKPLQCHVCRRPFGDPSNLNKHVRLHADGDSPYRCRHCGKVLVRRRDLERHIRSRHPGQESPTVVRDAE